MRSVVVPAIVVLILLCSPLGAEYVYPDLENVPIERLVANLERLLGESPDDVLLRLNLARVHAMAFAIKSDTAQIWRGRVQEGAWTGYEPKYTQFPVKEAPNAEADRIARTHLARAIARYREARALAPSTRAPYQWYPAPLDRVADLGLGWCLAQSGARDEAVAVLRRVVSDSWPVDPTAGGLFMGHRSLYEEAARYLIPLLDPVRDRDEISGLRQRSAEASKILRPITPIAIPLRAGLGALDITSDGAGVFFDADGSGIAKRWTWITPEAGWLVFDRHETRQIESALQLFGNVTFWLFWENGYRALRALDDNGDRQLTDRELESLAIWHDRNVNGRSDAGEVRPLSDWQVVALSCDYQIDPTHPDEIAYSRAGVTFRDGSSRPTFDIVLHPAGRTLSHTSLRR